MKLFPSFTPLTPSGTLDFRDPGAGAQGNAFSICLPSLQEALHKGRYHDALTLLQQEEGGTPVSLLTSVTSTTSGVTLSLPFSLATLLSTSQPTRVLKCLQKLKEAGYHWRSPCSLEGKDVPWEALCAFTWFVLRHRFSLRKTRQTSFQETVEALYACNKSAPAPSGAQEKAATPHTGNERKEETSELSALSLKKEVDAFITWQGGNPAQLKEPHQVRALIALAATVLDTAHIKHLTLFLKEVPLSFQEEAWSSPWREGPSPAERLAHRLGMQYARPHAWSILHAVSKRHTEQLSYVTPLDVLRLFRSAWDTEAFTPERSKVLCDRLLPREESYYGHRRRQTLLKTMAAVSEEVTWWRTQPGGQAIVHTLQSVLPLPSHALPPGRFGYKDTDAYYRFSPDLQKAITQYATTLDQRLVYKGPPPLKKREKEQQGSPVSARKMGNHFHAGLRSPLEETLSPALRGDTPKRVQRPVPEMSARPFLKKFTAPTVLTAMATWFETRNRQTTHDLLTKIKAYEHRNGAPFTFKAGQAPERWTLHGYMWARGTKEGEERSWFLTQEGYPPVAQGYYTPSSEEHPLTPFTEEPLEICILQRFSALLDSIPLNSIPLKSHGLDVALLDDHEAQLLAQGKGYTPDWNCQTSKGLPLCRALLRTAKLRTLLSLRAWLETKGVTLSLTAHDVEIVKERLRHEEMPPSQGASSSMLRRAAYLQDMVSTLEQQVLQESLTGHTSSATSPSSCRRRV